MVFCIIFALISENGEDMNGLGLKMKLVHKYQFCSRVTIGLNVTPNHLHTLHRCTALLLCLCLWPGFALIHEGLWQNLFLINAS